jgi:hypothetical protein
MSKDLDLRSAGEAITRGGHDRDVIRSSERELTDRGARGRRQQRESDYDDRANENERDYDDDFEDDDDFGDDEAEDSSNRARAEADDDEAEDEDGDDRDDNEQDDESDEPDDAERRRQSDDDDRLHEVTVNGEKFKVSTRELRDGYQRTQDYHQKTTELSRRRRELDTGHLQVAKQYQTKLQETEGALSYIGKLIAGDINGPDMQALRQSQNPQDRQEWQFRRQEIQDRIDAVNGLIGNIKQEQERHRQESTQRQQAELANHIGYELEALRRHVPDWDGEGKVRVSKSLVEDYGFSADEIQTVYDARMLMVAADAQKWRDLQKHKASTKDKRRRNKATGPAPKQARRRSGSELSRQPTPQRKRARAYEGAKAKARKTGDMRDAGRAIGHLLDR